jgi:hypothetical protein
MLTLDEEFETKYAAYCQEQDDAELVGTVESIQEAEYQFLKSVDSIQKYINLVEADPTVSGASAGAGGDENDDSHHDDGGTRRQQAKPAASKSEDKVTYEGVRDSITDMFNIFRSMEQDARDSYKQSMTATKGPSADVVPAYATVERISDMKFPQNIIFFFQQLITWIKNLILVVIEKLTRGIRNLFGMPNSRDDFLSKDDLKLNLNNVKSIERISTPLQAVKTDKNGNVAVPKLASLVYVPADQAVKYGMNFGESVSLKEATEDHDDHGDGHESDANRVSRNPTPVLIVDTTNDLAELKEYMQHFFDLFDNAVGSNNEDLFKTEDLDLMLTIFKKMEDDIKSGSVPTYQIGGQSIEGSAIDSEKMRDSLIRTKINTDNLKAAFQQTEKEIQLLTKIITQKQLLAISDMGVQYKFLSAATNEQLTNIIEVLSARLEQASQYEDVLADERKKYNDLVNEINSMRVAYGSVANVAYTSVYQRQINELFDSSKYMTQIVSLRLTTLTMYVQALRDLKEICINLNAVNTVHSMEPHRFEFGKFFDKSASAQKAFLKN